MGVGISRDSDSILITFRLLLSQEAVPLDSSAPSSALEL